MIQCNHCQKFNEPGTKFCINCGSPLLQYRSSELKPPPPYTWKTTEENLAQSQTLPPIPQQTFPLGQPYYYCHRCKKYVYPVPSSQISGAGWVVFALLLIFCLPLFWIGFLIREAILVCPFCRLKIQ